MNSKEVIRDNKIYVFVTRTKSKPFSDREISDYFKLDTNSKTEWQVPDNKQRKIMFMRDLQKGIEFCKNKYVVSEEDIVREARRLAPHVRI